MSALTQAELKSIIFYCPNRGKFLWLSGQRKGSIAGSISSSSGKPYLYIKIRKKRYQLHRVAHLYMTGRHPENVIDHIDGNSVNNIWSNLRDVTHKENARNQKLHNSNKSGVCGVSFYKKNNKYRSDICINGKTKHLGYFDNLFDAACSRISAQNKNGFHPNHGAKHEAL